MRKPGLLLLPMIIAALFVAIGCGGGGNNASVTPGGAQLSTTDLPAGFPTDFPVYPAASFKGGLSTTRQGENGFAATWETDAAIDQVKLYYGAKFGGGSAWQQDSTASTAEGTFFAFHRNDDQTKGGFLTISTQGSKTDFVVFLGENPGDAGAADGSESDALTPESNTP